jgi:hypothetical protein
MSVNASAATAAVVRRIALFVISIPSQGAAATPACGFQYSKLGLSSLWSQRTTVCIQIQDIACRPRDV